MNFISSKDNTNSIDLNMRQKDFLVSSSTWDTFREFLPLILKRFYNEKAISLSRIYGTFCNN